MSEGIIKRDIPGNPGRASMFGWALVGLYILLAIAGLFLLFQPGMPTGSFDSTWEAVLQVAGILIIAIIGGLIVSSHPHNPIGWIMVVVSIMLGLDLFAFSYAAYGLLINPGTLPGTLVMAVIADDFVFMAQMGLILVLLLFPDGRFLSPRWRLATWLMIATAFVANIIWFVTPGPFSELPVVENPLAINEGLYGTLQPFASFVSNILIPLFLLVGIVSLFIRFRRGDQIQKQQIKWFVFGTTPFVVGAIIQLVFQVPTTFSSVALVTLGLVTSPLAIALAIFKYRLYDIDFIINRTLVYTLLTSSIAIFYGVVVSASGLLMQNSSNLAGLIITGVIVLVVFRPLYSTLQRGVNRILPENHPPPAQPKSDNGLLTPTTTSSVTWPLFAQIVWVIFAIMAIVIIVAALPGYAAKFGGQLAHVTGTEVPPGAHFFAAASGLASLMSALLSLGLSAVLFRQKFNEPIAMLLSFFLLFYGIVMCGPLEAAATTWLGTASFATTIQSFFLATPLIALMLLFPNGRFVPHWTRWVLFLSLPWNIALLFLAPFDAQTLERTPLLSAMVASSFIGFGVIGLYAQIYRYFKVATHDERQQVRWAIYGFALWLIYILISSVPYYYLTSLPPDASTPWWGPASELSWWLSLNILPICLTIAITRYQLWNIDLVINRTLVYGILTVGVLILYALIVGGMGLYFRAEDNIVLPLLATGLAAILFHPLRLRLQQGINRLMYGDRDEPFDVLARLGERLENTLSPEMVYPTIVETVSQALKLPYAAVHVWHNGQWETAKSYGKPVPDPVLYPLTYQGETVGQLLVATRASGEAFSQADERILRNIARQAGAAVHAAQLVDDLQQSRHQLVTAREEERRRLRRDLHDGLGPHLASQTLTIDAIDKLLDRDPERARALLQDLKSQSQTAVKDIRRVVYNLRPPALDELGLIGALNEGAARQSQNGLKVIMEAPSQLPPLPAAVEVAAYRVAQEAITNVVRHAQAHHCFIRLGIDRSGKETRLRVEVEDDGQGLPTNYEAGVGLQSMRERTAELGGSCHIESVNGSGVRVTAVFPLPTT